MERKDNYLLQVEQARQYFLTYDQQTLIKKLKLSFDEEYLYTRMLGRPYRIRRKSGHLERQEGVNWQNADTHAEYMTLMDLLCDSRADRYLTFRWKNMVSFGNMFHRDLMETRDPFAEAIQQDMAAFHRACRSLQGTEQTVGDISYAIELFDGLCVVIRFWEADEDFPAQVVWFWDENALMYLKYETMWFAMGLLKNRILKEMKDLTV